jgi:cytoskeletal protein CcmA (bactofilin family)
MINKNSLFGKREETTPPQSSVRPAGYGMQPTATAKTESNTVPMPKPETTTSSLDSTTSTTTTTSTHMPPLEDSAHQGSKLIVGPGIKLKGAEIQDCDTLVVEGRVEATMDSRVIQIADQGSFAGKVNIDVAEIRGRFEGELTARKQLIIHATGHVSGTIRYGKIVIQEGGELTGDVKSLSAGEAGASGDLLDMNSKSFGAKSA